MQRKAGRIGRLCLPGAAVLAGLLAGAAPVGATAPDTDAWRDIESRIQYAYYTEDPAALRQLAPQLAPGESADAQRAYYAALLAWRQALLAAGSAGSARAAAPYAGRCLSEIDAALALEAQSAEALALRAACLALPPGAAGLTSLSGHRARRDLERAAQLAPRNPRVLLVAALTAPTAGSAEGAAAARREVEAFEVERGGVEPVPGWGAAEGWLLLARALLAGGDAVGARDALEHALLIAPDYAEARRLMTRLTTG